MSSSGAVPAPVPAPAPAPAPAIVLTLARARVEVKTDHHAPKGKLETKMYLQKQSKITNWYTHNYKNAYGEYIAFAPQSFEVKTDYNDATNVGRAIKKWSVKIGDSIKTDTVLYTIITQAGAEEEIKSNQNGILTDIFINENDIIPPGGRVCIFTSDVENYKKYWIKTIYLLASSQDPFTINAVNKDVKPIDGSGNNCADFDDVDTKNINKVNFLTQSNECGKQLYALYRYFADSTYDDKKTQDVAYNNVDIYERNKQIIDNATKIKDELRKKALDYVLKFINHDYNTLLYEKIDDNARKEAIKNLLKQKGKSTSVEDVETWFYAIISISTINYKKFFPFILTTEEIKSVLYSFIEKNKLFIGCFDQTTTKEWISGSTTDTEMTIKQTDAEIKDALNEYFDKNVKDVTALDTAAADAAVRELKGGSWRRMGGTTYATVDEFILEITKKITDLLLDDKRYNKLNDIFKLCIDGQIKATLAAVLSDAFFNKGVILETYFNSKNKNAFLIILYTVLNKLSELFPNVKEYLESVSQYRESDSNKYYYKNKLYAANDSFDKLDQESVFEKRITLDARQYITVNRFTRFRDPTDKACFLLHGVGTGKTITSLSIAITHLTDDNADPKTPLKILVMAPQGIFQASFMKDGRDLGIYTYELCTYTNVEPKNIANASETDIVQIQKCKGVLKKNDNTEYYIEFTSINYPNLISKNGFTFLNEIAGDRGFDVLLCDEAHQFLTKSLQPYDKYKRYDLDCTTQKPIVITSLSDDERSQEILNETLEYFPLLAQLTIKAFPGKFPATDITRTLEILTKDQVFATSLLNSFSSVNGMVSFTSKLLGLTDIKNDPIQFHAKLMQVIEEDIDWNTKITSEQSDLLLYSVTKLFSNYNAINRTIAGGKFVAKTLSNVTEGDTKQTIAEIVSTYYFCDLNNLIRDTTLMAEKLLNNNKFHGNILTDNRFLEFVGNKIKKQAVFLTGTPFQKSNNDIIDIIWFLNNPLINKSNLDEFCKDVLDAGGNALFKPFEKPGAWKTTKDYKIWFTSVGFDIFNNISSLTDLSKYNNTLTDEDETINSNDVVVNAGKALLANAQGDVGSIVTNLSDYITNFNKDDAKNYVLEKTFASKLVPFVTQITGKPENSRGDPGEKNVWDELFGSSENQQSRLSTGLKWAKDRTDKLQLAAATTILSGTAQAATSLAEYWEKRAVAQPVPGVTTTDQVPVATTTTTSINGNIELECVCKTKPRQMGGAGDDIAASVLATMTGTILTNQYFFTALGDIYNKIVRDSGGKITVSGILRSALKALFDLLISMPKITIELAISLVNIMAETFKNVLLILFEIDNDNVIKHSASFISIYNYDYEQLAIEQDKFYKENINKETPVFDAMVNVDGNTNAFPLKDIDQILIPYTSEQLKLIGSSFGINFTDDELFSFNSLIGCYDQTLFDYVNAESNKIKNEKTKETITSTVTGANAPPPPPPNNSDVVLNKEEPNLTSSVIDALVSSVPDMFNTSNNSDLSKAKSYINKIVIGYSEDYKQKLRDKFKTNNLVNLNNQQVSVVKSQLFKKDDKIGMQINIDNVSGEDVKETTFNIPINIENGFNTAIIPLSDTGPNERGVNYTYTQLFNKPKDSIEHFTDYFDRIKYGDVVPRFQYALMLLLVIKSGLIYSSQNNSQLISKEGERKSAESNFYLHAHYVKAIENPPIYKHYLPVVYPPTMEVMYAFVSYLNMMGYKYLWMCDNGTTTDEGFLNQNYKAAANHSYDVIYNIFDNIDTKYKVKPDNVDGKLQTQPICLIISPAHVEGFSFNWSPAIICLSLCKSSGDAEQVYGRILRKYFMPSLEGKYCKKIYQLFGGTRIDSDNLDKYANKYGSFGQTFKSIYKEIENRKREDQFSVLSDTLVMRNFSKWFITTQQTLLKTLPQTVNNFIRNSVKPQISRYGGIGNSEKLQEQLQKEKLQEIFSCEDLQLTTLTAVNDIGTKFFKSLVEIENSTLVEDSNPETRKIKPFDLQTTDSIILEKQENYCVQNEYNSILCRDVIILPTPLAAAAAAAAAAAGVIGNYNLDVDKLNALFNQINKNRFKQISKDAFIELNKLFINNHVQLTGDNNHSLKFDLVFNHIYQKLYNDETLSEDDILRILSQRNEVVEANPSILNLISENYIMLLYRHWNYEYAKIVTKYQNKIISSRDETGKINTKELDKIMFYFNREVQTTLKSKAIIPNDIDFIFSPYSKNIYYILTFEADLKKPYDDFSLNKIISYLPILWKVFTKLNEVGNGDLLYGVYKKLWDTSTGIVGVPSNIYRLIKNKIVSIFNLEDAGITNIGSLTVLFPIVLNVKKLINTPSVLSTILPAPDYSVVEREKVRSICMKLIDLLENVSGDSINIYNKVILEGLGGLPTIIDILYKSSVQIGIIDGAIKNPTISNLMDAFGSLKSREMYQLIEIVNRELTNISEKTSAGNTTATFKNYHINPYIPKFLLNYRKNYVKTFDKLCEFIINDYNPVKPGFFNNITTRTEIAKKNSEVDAAKLAVSNAEKELKELTDEYQEYKTKTGLNRDDNLEKLIKEKYENIISLRKTVETTSQSSDNESNKFIELYNQLIQRFEGLINEKYSKDIDDMYSFMNHSQILRYIPTGDTLSYLFNGYLYRMPLIYFDYHLSSMGELVHYTRPSPENVWQPLTLTKKWINYLLLFYANRFYELNGFNYPFLSFIMSQNKRAYNVEDYYTISKGDHQNIIHKQSFKAGDRDGAIIIKIESNVTGEYDKLIKSPLTDIKNKYESELNKIIESIAQTVVKPEVFDLSNVNRLINLITAYDLIKNGQADIKKYNDLVSIIPKEPTTGGTRRYRRTKNQRLNKPRITKRFKSNYSINERLYSKKKIKNKTKRR